MSGNTGKMTADAVAFRGPRTVLIVCGDKCQLLSEYDPWPEGFRRLATSYSIAYLRRIAKANGYEPAAIHKAKGEL